MKAPTPTLASLLESFFRKRLVAQRRASPETIVAYRHALRLLILFAAARLGSAPSRLTLDHFDSDLVLAFLDDLEARRGNSVRTRNARLAAIRSFFHHVAFSDPALMGVAQRIVSLPGKRTSRRVVSFLTREELDVILAVPDLAAAQGRRDRALLLFLARTGARVTEAISVSATDLRLDRPSQVLLHGKGSKPFSLEGGSSRYRRRGERLPLRHGCAFGHQVEPAGFRSAQQVECRGRPGIDSRWFEAGGLAPRRRSLRPVRG